jgi:predicted acylesterase/phospholipase RssA
MRERGRRRTLRWIAAAGVVLGVLDVSACTTKGLVAKFNSGLLDSAGDPCRSPRERSETLVKQVVTHELMDGYFSQGERDGDVERWLVSASRQTGYLVQAVHGEACALGNDLGVACPPDEADGGAATFSTQLIERPSTPGRHRAQALGELWRGGRVGGDSVCKDGKLDPRAAASLADAVRFDAAVGRATSALVALAIEGLVDLHDVEVGAHEAFGELHAYLQRRGWRRRFDRRSLGLVVEGGATTGLYSAGVVWTALNLVDACRSDPACSKAVPDLEFDLVSGTSTGAMISVATEVFNAAKTAEARKTALDSFVDWFTCLGVADLYCVRDGDATSLLRDQRGMVEFDGIASHLTQGLGGIDVFSNHSELVLNTVDFRTGALLDLSDQDELYGNRNEVVRGAIASAVLPFIADPVPHLPTDWHNPQFPEMRPLFSYLDGGIRAELPILPLARRGAERVLIVASSASVTGGTTPLKSALDIAIRYIDVSVGGVTESEIAHAERHVESVRLAEVDSCRNELRSVAPSPFDGDDDDDDAVRAQAFCESNWDDACAPPPRSGAERPRRFSKTPGSAFDLTGETLQWLWGTRSFFRNEVEVEGLHGYSFDTGKTRQLFLAGAEAARERCPEIAALLGIPTAMVRADGALFPACARPLAHACANHNASELRSCTGPRPVTFTGVCR